MLADGIKQSDILYTQIHPLDPIFGPVSLQMFVVATIIAMMS